MSEAKMNEEQRGFPSRVRYKDLRYQRDGEFAIELDAARRQLMILLDLDVDAVGGFFSGECLLAMTRHQSVEFVHLLVEALGRSAEISEQWYPVGTVACSWLDPDEPGGGAGSGVSVMCSHHQVRIVISPGSGAVADDYVATLDRAAVDELITALSRSMSLLESPGDG
jgi:hypothetical protein